MRVEGRDAIVEAVQSGGCGHCDSAKGCGSGKLSQLFCAEPRRFRVRNDIEARIGEEVQVSVADGVLLKSALVMYFVPLLSALGGGALGGSLAAADAAQDLYAATGAALGLLLGFLLIRLSVLRHASALGTPVIGRHG